MVALQSAFGCDFGDSEYLAAHGELRSAGNALEISADSSIVWAYNNAGALSQIWSPISTATARGGTSAGSSGTGRLPSTVRYF